MTTPISVICDVPITSIENEFVRVTRVTINQRSWFWCKSPREYNKKPRIFPWISNFSVKNDIFEGERYNKPHKYLKPLLRQALKAAGVPEREVDNLKFSWSVHAGCSCPCSPGFIVNNATSLSHKDVSIEYEYVNKE